MPKPTNRTTDFSVDAAHGIFSVPETALSLVRCRVILCHHVSLWMNTDHFKPEEDCLLHSWRISLANSSQHSRGTSLKTLGILSGAYAYTSSSHCLRIPVIGLLSVYFPELPHSPMASGSRVSMQMWVPSSCIVLWPLTKQMHTVTGASSPSQR